MNQIQGVAKGSGANRIKKRIRDLERLLKKPQLAATQKIEAERALKSLKGDLVEAQKGRKVAVNKKKYHMVRFFESKKSLKRLKQAVKKVEADEMNEDQLLEAETNYHYVREFPEDEKYQALYAENVQYSDRQIDLRNDISKRIKSGDLPNGKMVLESLQLGS